MPQTAPTQTALPPSTPLIIAFTGHRNRITDESELARIQATHPGATWLHGAAAGFDQQVAAYAHRHSIPVQAIPPDYRRHKRAAPFIRNRALVDAASLLIACCDGRPDGGAAYTCRYATQRGIPIHPVPAHPVPGQPMHPLMHDTAPQTSTSHPPQPQPQRISSPSTA